MALELSSAAVPDLVAMAKDFGITIDLGAADLRRLEARASALVEAAENTAALISDLCGPAACPVGGQVRTLLLMGTGYHRSVRDGLRAMLAARARKFRPAKAGKIAGR